ncbi:hypothetical protein PCANC_03762 [Puccinia coronata f. sp. avenae]|uniref:Integrase catalytic domain-containing protein n=1 Tax=Puccinia coronata f. sp. avenae TaxID=200324 RepID=A0A2N5UZC5_9BASI|nr:hypothetical protein PCASD_06041 [Puccinia coronata f. sp. avenae]PLW53907.1 hypothetical protein PCANC_03762 [Puccinia coronata f. sp. avenae]
MATGFSEEKVLESKDRACDLLMEIILRWEQQTSKKVKILRTNNSGEFSSKVLEFFNKTHGINTKQALPYHHYQNGVIEHFNRTVADMNRTILINIEIGIRPTCKQARFFGQQAFIHVHTENRRKLDDWELEGQVVAHRNDSKGWVFLMKHSSHLVASAIVEWEEKKPPIFDPTDKLLPKTTLTKQLPPTPSNLQITDPRQVSLQENTQTQPATKPCVPV